MEKAVKMKGSVDISAVILAGGKNRRFGGKLKGLSMIEGRRIIDRELSVFRELFDEILIITNSPEQLNGISGCVIVSDVFKKVGPLAGIHAAMKYSTKKSIFVFASDMPFLRSDLIAEQVNHSFIHKADAVIPQINGSIEPLHGIYQNHLLSKLEDYISSGDNYSLKGFLDKINVDLFIPIITDDILRAFTNINTRGEAEKFGK